MQATTVTISAGSIVELAKNTVFPKPCEWVLGHDQCPVQLGCWELLRKVCFCMFSSWFLVHYAVKLNLTSMLPQLSQTCLAHHLFICSFKYCIIILSALSSAWPYPEETGICIFLVWPKSCNSSLQPSLGFRKYMQSTKVQCSVTYFNWGPSRPHKKCPYVPNFAPMPHQWLAQSVLVWFVLTSIILYHKAAAPRQTDTALISLLITSFKSIQIWTMLLSIFHPTFCSHYGSLSLHQK